MSQGIWVIIGGLLAGGFLIVGQLVASSWQANTSREASAAQAAMAREASAAQAEMAREAWNRSQRALQHTQLETACLDVIRYIQQIQTAVENWENGNMQAAQGLAVINSADRAVLEAGYGILLRKPHDQSGPLIGRVVNQASVFTGLYAPGRTPPATAAEKRAQCVVVSAAGEAVFNHMHQMLRADAEGS